MNRPHAACGREWAEILTLQRLVPSSVFQLLHDISSALDNRSIRCFLNRKIYFSIREV